MILENLYVFCVSFIDWTISLNKDVCFKHMSLYCIHVEAKQFERLTNSIKKKAKFLSFTTF